jgi:hypothetical protein
MFESTLPSIMSIEMHTIMSTQSIHPFIHTRLRLHNTSVPRYSTVVRHDAAIVVRAEIARVLQPQVFGERQSQDAGAVRVLRAC